MVLLWLSENFGHDALDRHHSSGLPRNRPPSARRPHRKLIVNKDEKVGDFTPAFCWEMLMGIFQQWRSLRRGMNLQLQPSFCIYYRVVWGDSYWVGAKTSKRLISWSSVQSILTAYTCRSHIFFFGSVFGLHHHQKEKNPHRSLSFGAEEDSVGESSDKWRRKPTI